MRTNEELTKALDDDFRGVIKQLTDSLVAAATDCAVARPIQLALRRGTALIVTPADFPKNDFLVSGKTYPIVVRHATPRPAMGGNTDDRTLDGAAISLKFLQPDDATGLGFHDVLMNTGRVMFVPSARAFNMMIHTPFGKRGPLIAAGVINDDNLTEAYRSGSFTEFYYYAQIVFEFTDASGAMQYIRFRIIPADRGPERGRFPASIRANGDTFTAAWPDDHRAEDYRRRQFEVQVNHLTVNYLLQAQLHPSDDPDALNSMKYWDEKAFPWIDLARLHLDKIMTYEEMDALEFDANRTHNCINLPLAKNADDHASLGHARALVYWHARKARAGAPKPHKV